jgi:Pyocin activator protein PrtN
MTRSAEGVHGRVRLQRVISMAEDSAHTAPTLFLLMAQYNGQTVVPLDTVCRDFFGHLTVEKLLRKVLRGDIGLPIVRIETSQKAQRGVHLVDLAAYIDERRAAALKECHQLAGTT